MFYVDNGDLVSASFILMIFYNQIKKESLNNFIDRTLVTYLDFLQRLKLSF